MTIDKSRIKQIVRKAVQDRVKLTETEFLAQNDRMVAAINAIYPQWEKMENMLIEFEDALIELENTKEFDALLDLVPSTIQERIKKMNQEMVDFTNTLHDTGAFMHVRVSK